MSEFSWDNKFVGAQTLLAKVHRYAYTAINNLLKLFEYFLQTTEENVN